MDRRAADCLCLWCCGISRSSGEQWQWFWPGASQTGGNYCHAPNLENGDSHTNSRRDFHIAAADRYARSDDDTYPAGAADSDAHADTVTNSDAYADAHSDPLAHSDADPVRAGGGGSS